VDVMQEKPMKIDLFVLQIFQGQRESNTDQNHCQEAGLLGYTARGKERK
jgi:hypothetical protein